MYTALELRTLNIKPRINDISLKILSEYYQMFLAPFIYNYHIVSKTEEKDIKLNFELENFCHLLGIESTVKNSVPLGNYIITEVKTVGIMYITKLLIFVT